MPPLLARNEKTSGTKKAKQMRNILVALTLLLSAAAGLPACGDLTDDTPPTPSTITRGAMCAETGNAFCQRLTECAAITVSACLASYLPGCCSGAECNLQTDAGYSHRCAAGFPGFACSSLMAEQAPASCQ